MIHGLTSILHEILMCSFMPIMCVLLAVQPFGLQGQNKVEVEVVLCGDQFAQAW